MLDPISTTALIIGFAVPTLISMGIFATKADVERLRGDIASDYVLKTELKNQLERIEALVNRLIDMMEKRNEWH